MRRSRVLDAGGPAEAEDDEDKGDRRQLEDCDASGEVVADPGTFVPGAGGSAVWRREERTLV